MGVEWKQMSMGESRHQSTSHCVTQTQELLMPQSLKKCVPKFKAVFILNQRLAKDWETLLVCAVPCCPNHLGHAILHLLRSHFIPMSTNFYKTGSNVSTDGDNRQHIQPLWTCAVCWKCSSSTSANLMSLLFTYARKCIVNDTEQPCFKAILWKPS